MVNLRKRSILKLNKFEKSFTVLFFVIVIIELFSKSLSPLSSLHHIAKPLILVSLILFFYLKSEHLAKKVRKLTLVALVFSLSGDLLLMFDHVSPNYFLAGLGSFLLSHLFYTLVFLDKRNKEKTPILFPTLIVVYAISLLFILKNGLGNLVIPVVIYVFAILSMAIAAILRKGVVTSFSYKLALIGALLFVISDTFIAINKFYTTLTNEHFLIMSTYALAQYCIVMGIIKQKN